MTLDIEDLKTHVEENTKTKTVGKTSLRLDSGVVSDSKAKVGVTQNTEFAPFVEAVVLDAVGLEERAEDKLEEFKQQFVDED